MSAPTTYATIDMDAPGIPMSRLVKVELRKLVNTRAGFWLVVSMGIIAVLITTAMLIWAPVDQLTFGNLFGIMNLPTGFLLPVVAILLVTSEWSPVSYTHLRAHETVLDLVCRLLLEK